MIRERFADGRPDQMKLQKIITLSAAAALTIALSHFAIAQQTNGSPGAQTGSQRSGGSASPATAGQGGSDEATLEIAPQPGASMPKPGVEEIPSDRKFRPGEDNADVEPSFRPRTENGTGDNGNDENFRPHRRPYVGITVRYTTQCYLGMEEHGLEVETVDPNSPAAQAGLQAKTGMTAVGAAGTTASGMLGPLNMLVMPLLEKGGALGQGGDLIVAVDERRVRDQGDLETAMARLKPGDTMYLTVIRPDGKSHKTMKIAVKLGAVGEPIANAAPASGLTH
jgi:hypothetical protein